MTELILGTAQFGDGYGVTNAPGRLDDDQVARSCTSRHAKASLCSTPPTPTGTPDRGSDAMPAGLPVCEQVRPRGGFRPPGLSGMIQRPRRGSASGGSAAAAAPHPTCRRSPAPRRASPVARRPRRRRVGRIGVSIYDRADLERAIERIPDLGVIQFPGAPSIAGCSMIRSSATSTTAVCRSRSAACSCRGCCSCRPRSSPPASPASRPSARCRCARRAGTASTAARSSCSLPPRAPVASGRRGCDDTGRAAAIGRAWRRPSPRRGEPVSVAGRRCSIRGAGRASVTRRSSRRPPRCSSRSRTTTRGSRGRRRRRRPRPARRRGRAAPSPPAAQRTAASPARWAGERSGHDGVDPDAARAELHGLVADQLQHRGLAGAVVRRVHRDAFRVVRRVGATMPYMLDLHDAATVRIRRPAARPTRNAPVAETRSPPPSRRP